MTDERAIEILDPEHREHYESIEPVEEACRIGIKAIKRVKELEAENAALRERLEKAIELPHIERLFNGKVGSYKVVYQDKNNRITSEYYSDEKREAAEARLAELKGEKK